MGNWFHDLWLFGYAVINHWQAFLTGGIVTAGIGIYEHKRNRNLSWQSYVVLISAFLLISFFEAWRDEHRNTSSVVTEKSILTSQLNECSIDLRATKGSLHDKESLADSLQTALGGLQGPQAQMAANVATCINTLAKMIPAVRERISVIEVPIAFRDMQGFFGFGAAPQNLYLTELFFLTNIPQERFRGYLQCSSPFTPYGTPEIQPDSDWVIGSSPAPQKISENEYLLRIEKSGVNWNASHPAYIQVVSNTQAIGKCTFSQTE